ncbi:MAG: exodeoxyribonuclease VII small subunit [Halioglobus sp.]
MASPKPESIENATHEAIIERVESIVNIMEQRDTKLEDSITFFEEGIGLLKTAQDNLAKAEQRVVTLCRVEESDEDGDEMPS